MSPFADARHDAPPSPGRSSWSGGHGRSRRRRDAERGGRRCRHPGSEARPGGGCPRSATATSTRGGGDGGRGGGAGDAVAPRRVRRGRSGRARLARHGSPRRGRALRLDRPTPSRPPGGRVPVDALRNLRLAVARSNALPCRRRAAGRVQACRGGDRDAGGRHPQPYDLASYRDWTSGRSQLPRWVPPGAAGVPRRAAGRHGRSTSDRVSMFWGIVTSHWNDERSTGCRAARHASRRRWRAPWATAWSWGRRAVVSGERPITVRAEQGGAMRTYEADTVVVATPPSAALGVPRRGAGVESRRAPSAPFGAYLSVTW